MSGVGVVMSRFYERYGHVIVWVLTAILGTLICTCAIFYAANKGYLFYLNKPALIVQNFLFELAKTTVKFVRAHAPVIGAIATVGTFIFGLVNGVMQARRYLPTRLTKLMQTALAPVYASPDLLLAAIPVPSASMSSERTLFVKASLDGALDTLAGPWRPRKESSLDETIAEADSHIALTKTRLQCLEDLRCHALLLRGTVRSCNAGPSDDAGSILNLSEADFTSAEACNTTKVAAIELRGMLRSRLGNLRGAAEDFDRVAAIAATTMDVLRGARASRLKAEIKTRQSNETGTVSLDSTRTQLNSARDLLDDGRTLSSAELLELGQNRIAYGMLQERMDEVNGGRIHLARDAYSLAIDKYLTKSSDPRAPLIADEARRRRNAITGQSLS